MWKTLLRGALALALLSSPVLGQQVWKWSQTPATNATADPAINWATGMAPSAVSPSARAMMAAVAKYRADTAGRLVTGGTSTAYTVTTNSGYAATPADGTRLALTVHVTNGISPTLQADSGTVFPIQIIASGSAVPAASLVGGSPYDFVFSSTSSAWIVVGYFGNPSSVPVGAVLDYAGASAPNSNFALAFGQCISRTTYAALFAIVSTTYGACDGTTTFGLPDSQGRAVFGKSNMSGSDSGRITVAGGNFDGTVLGGAGGLQNHLLLIGEVPAHTVTGTIGPNPYTPQGGVTGFTPASSINAFTPTGSVATNLSSAASGVLNNQGVGGGANVTGGGGAYNIGAITASSTYTGNSITLTGSAITPNFVGVPQTLSFAGNSIGGGAAHTILPPAIILSKIIRIF